MRSRYSAFALGDAGYLERTWHSSTRPRHLKLDSATRWTRLEVLGTTGGGPFHTEGTVEFDAHHRERGGREQVLHENSAFVREGGAWVYLSAL